MRASHPLGKRENFSLVSGGAARSSNCGDMLFDAAGRASGEETPSGTWTTNPGYPKNPSARHDPQPNPKDCKQSMDAVHRLDVDRSGFPGLRYSRTPPRGGSAEECHFSRQESCARALCFNSPDKSLVAGSLRSFPQDSRSS